MSLDRGKRDMAVRVLLADDHKIVRDGLRSLLEKQQGMEVVAEAENGRQALELARQKKPHVVIMDVSMPDLNGIEATRQMVVAQPGVRVIALSMHSDRRLVAGMLRAGACGFLLKDCAFDELARAINAVMSNEPYLSPRIAGTVIQDYVRRMTPTESPTPDALTTREREVLQLLAEGWSTKQISSHLHVSVKTAETHRRQIMDKLGLHSIAELTKYAIREGLTSLEP
jgi:two-component system response regulator NreC